MIDNNEEVYGVLSVIGTTFFQYPDSFATFPIISYWDSSHEADDYEDGKSGVDRIETTVDVWEKEDANGNLIKIHEQMDSAMRAAWFARTNPIIGMYENDIHIFHYQGKYKKLYEEID
jgi:hypothetical protein